MHRRVVVGAISTIILIPGASNEAAAQSLPDLPAFCDYLFQSGLNEKQLPGGSVAVVDGARVLLTRIYFAGYLISALIFVGFPQQWHFTGYHY